MIGKQVNISKYQHIRIIGLMFISQFINLYPRNTKYYTCQSIIQRYLCKNTMNLLIILLVISAESFC